MRQDTCLSANSPLVHRVADYGRITAGRSVPDDPVGRLSSCGISHRIASLSPSEQSQHPSMVPTACDDGGGFARREAGVAALTRVRPLLDRGFVIHFR
jgi:hypothetical protein